MEKARCETIDGLIEKPQVQTHLKGGWIGVFKKISRILDFESEA